MESTLRKTHLSKKIVGFAVSFVATAALAIAGMGGEKAFATDTSPIINGSHPHTLVRNNGAFEHSAWIGLRSDSTIRTNSSVENTADAKSYYNLSAGDPENSLDIVYYAKNISATTQGLNSWWWFNDLTNPTNVSWKVDTSALPADWLNNGVSVDTPSFNMKPGYYYKNGGGATPDFATLLNQNGKIIRKILGTPLQAFGLIPK